MPKGRGSNQRRRSRRQKFANVVNRLPPGDPDGIAEDEARSERMVGDYKRANWQRRLLHPLQRGGDR